MRESLTSEMSLTETRREYGIVGRDCVLAECEEGMRSGNATSLIIFSPQ